MPNIEYVSQNNRSDVPKDTQDIGCGVACTMMLLKYYCARPNCNIVIPSYQDLCYELRIYDLPETKGYDEFDETARGAFAEDIQAYLTKLDLRYRTSFDYDGLKGRIKRGPIMIELCGEVKGHPHIRDGHWVLLIEIADNDFVYLDPWLKGNETSKKQVKMNKQEFKKYWTLNAIQIVEPNPVSN